MTDLEKEQISEMASQLGDSFETIETVDFMPKIKEKGVFYLIGKAKVTIKYFLPNSFVVTNISIK